MSTEFIDKGLARHMRDMQRLAEMTVEVGVLSKDADTKYEDGSTVGEVAIFNEFGTARVPARPFMSGAFDQYKEQIKEKQDQLAAKVSTGQMTPEAAAAEVGKWFQAAVQTHILNGNFQPNALSTMKAKGNGQVLLDSKLLFNSISHGVRKQ